MTGYRDKVRGGFAGCAWLLIVGCNGQLHVGDTVATGGAGGSVSNGSGGRAVQILSQSETASVLGTSASCPTEGVTDLESCSEEHAICGYRGTTSQGQEYAECGCYEAGAGALRWFCYEGEGGAVNCPLTQPKAGASCFGSFGMSCHYPVQTICSCNSEVGTWSCEASLPIQDYLEPPTTLNLATPVVNLTDADRLALCTWHVDARLGPGFPHEVAQVGPDGFVINSGCAACSDFASNGRIPTLSLEQCVSNLGLSTCAAPASELVDCVATIYGACRPKEHGCARYTEKPGCDGTLVTTDTDSPKSASFCSIRVR